MCALGPRPRAQTLALTLLATLVGAGGIYRVCTLVEAPPWVAVTLVLLIGLGLGWYGASRGRLR